MPTTPTLKSKLKSKFKPQKPSHSPSSSSSPKTPHPLHQPLLNIFTNAFPGLISSPAHLDQNIQKLKSHLYARDFTAAFCSSSSTGNSNDGEGEGDGDREMLEAYAVRWSPVRALGYFEVLNDVIFKTREKTGKGALLDRGGVEEAGGKGEKEKVLCLGGGAGAEVVALAGCLGRLEGDAEGAEGEMGAGFEIRAVDIAPWSLPLRKLVDALTCPPPISQYASAAVKEANMALVDAERFSVGFLQRDLLEIGKEELCGSCDGCCEDDEVTSGVDGGLGERGDVGGGG
ncbi:MAG: hypothetical protein Q9219_003759 [cf. Caloplaca sp. 3 TL-2023]